MILELLKLFSKYENREVIVGGDEYVYRKSIFGKIYFC